MGQVHSTSRPEPARDPFREYAWGTDAARLFGVADAASVWRQIARHAGDYPGEIEVVQIGGHRKVVRRDQLIAFARWFAAGPGLLDKRVKIGVVEAVPEATAPGGRPLAAIEERRARLRAAIARLAQ